LNFFLKFWTFFLKFWTFFSNFELFLKPWTFFSNFELFFKFGLFFQILNYFSNFELFFKFWTFFQIFNIFFKFWTFFQIFNIFQIFNFFQILNFIQILNFVKFWTFFLYFSCSKLLFSVPHNSNGKHRPMECHGYLYGRKCSYHSFGFTRSSPKTVRRSFRDDPRWKSKSQCQPTHSPTQQKISHVELKIKNLEKKSFFVKQKYCSTHLYLLSTHTLYKICTKHLVYIFADLEIYTRARK